MEFDIVVVGAGPAGLATACRIKQLCQAQNIDLSVCLVEKGSEIGAHILSGAIIETRALDELFPDWQKQGAPLTCKVTEDEFHFLTSARHSIKIPHALLPASLSNSSTKKTHYVASLGNLCRWLGEQAEQLGVEIFSGFSAAEILYDEQNKVIGIATGDMGLNKAGEEKSNFERGYELIAKYTVFSEGCRGHLGKQLIARFNLDQHKSAQHYALGIKELWKIPSNLHRPGKVMHGLGWPLGFGKTTGGWFLYHLEGSQIAVGLITDLNYRNPWLSPFDEFQRLKHHPLFVDLFNQSTRISYGARALVKGGVQALPKLAFPGGVLVGDEAGFLNFAKIKGSHAAIKSGILAAESLVTALTSDDGVIPEILDGYQQNYENSWLQEELYSSRNCAPAFHKFGTLAGSLFNFIDQTIFRGKLPFTLQDKTEDSSTLSTASQAKMISYDKPDGKISFDKLSSVYLSNTNHEEDQPCHLHLTNPEVPIKVNLPDYAEPAQRYCPAGVYEIIISNNVKELQINAQNCVHCKTCDIKDPSENITWLAPEGSGGPNYPNM